MARFGIRSKVLSNVLLAGAMACACSSASTDPEVPPNVVETLPCDVAVALREGCQGCHADPAASGVPMPLVTFAQTQAPWTHLPTYDKVPTWKVMGDAIDANWMPPPLPDYRLSDFHRQTILAWIRRGAPAAPAGMTCP